MGNIDIATKQYMSHKDIIADAFNFFIYDGRQVVNPEKLQKYAKQVEEAKRSYRDKTKEKKIKLNSEEFLSGFRKEDKLMPVITLVVYFGDKHWDGARSIHEMLSIKNKELLSYVPDYKINLIEPASILV